MIYERKPVDSHYARLRRQHRAEKQESLPADLSNTRIRIYGTHTVEAALRNPRRIIHRLFITKNALLRLESTGLQLTCPIELIEAKKLGQLLGHEAVHQGIMIETESLPAKKSANLKRSSLIILLDQITDPHNVGAIMRSAVAFNADTLITTTKYSPQETGVLAKAASGALELIDYVTVRNLANTLDTLNQAGFQTFGLDSEGKQLLETTLSAKQIALVLGAEGKGLRQKIRQKVSHLVRLDIPGAIQSLNVSNAAAIALYNTHTYLKNNIIDKKR